MTCVVFSFFVSLGVPPLGNLTRPVMWAIILAAGFLLANALYLLIAMREV